MGIFIAVFFIKLCELSQVDLRSPSIKQIFKNILSPEKNLQPSTINSYRTAIVDKIENNSLNMSKDENLNRLLDSFH